MDDTYPILEFDPTPEALLEPSRLLSPRDVPEHCVICFFREVIRGLVEAGTAREVTCLRSEIGSHPIHEIAMQGRRLGVYHPGMGAPMAGGSLEELIAVGCRKFIVCGGAGVLQPELACGHLVVPATAVRDEGTSYHYLPPSREVAAHPDAVAAVEATLQAQGCEYILAKTWTTDAVYRETRGKIARRRDEGCVTVEMEAAAFFAVAQFRGVPLAQILYCGDDCSGDTWDHRNWHRNVSVRERLFWLAAEACLRL